MKIVPLVVVVSLVGFAATLPAFAQPDSPEGGAGNPSQSEPDMDGPGHMRGGAGWDRDRDGEWGASRHHRGPMQNGMMRRGMMMQQQGMMRGGGGAHFRLSRGNARIDIRCPANETVQACVDAASTLIDKVTSLHARPNAPGNTNGAGVERNIPSPSPGTGGENAQPKAPGEPM